MLRPWAAATRDREGRHSENWRLRRRAGVGGPVPDRSGGMPGRVAAGDLLSRGTDGGLATSGCRCVLPHRLRPSTDCPLQRRYIGLKSNLPGALTERGSLTPPSVRPVLNLPLTGQHNTGSGHDGSDGHGQKCNNQVTPEDDFAEWVLAIDSRPILSEQ